jgi:hypothetical protein
MKHIKKKYAFESKVLPNEVGNKTIRVTNPKMTDLNNSKITVPFIQTDDGTYVKTFKFSKNSNEHIIIPIPDLTLVYFDSAYNLNKLRIEQEEKLYTKLKITEDKLGEQAINEIYRYYGYATSCVISLFTTLESFINHMIPDNSVYQKTLNHRTEVYTKEQIQKAIQFEDKIKDVLPQLLDITFQLKSPAYTHIQNLKKLRDDIVHTKSDQNLMQQEELIKRLLKFSFEETFNSVAKFINHYKQDYVIECDCGLDF